jgi:PAS domain-containing protein
MASDKRTRDQHALAYAENIIATLREPFVVLDKSLRVHTANAAFYRGFHVTKEETEGRFVYELGNGQWNIPQLRTLLPQVLSNSHPLEDFEVEHVFPALGRRNMLLNARRFPPDGDDAELVLLAIEDNTSHKQAEAAVQHSEVRYRRLFQTAKDGILTRDGSFSQRLTVHSWRSQTGFILSRLCSRCLW